MFVRFTLFSIYFLSCSIGMGASESLPQTGNASEIMDSRKQMKKSYQFNTRVQREKEDFNNFYNNVSQLVKECGYGDLADRILRDKIISGSYDGNLRNHLLGTENLTLEQAREEAVKWQRKQKGGKLLLYDSRFACVI